MCKTISITAWQRPEYLKQVLASIKEAAPVGYKLFIGLEPGNPHSFAVAQSVDWIEKKVIVNPERYGVRRNPFNLLSTVFSAEVGSSFNLYLEEDVIVAPDAFKLAEWFTSRSDAEQWLALNLLNYDSDIANPRGIIQSNRFNSLGMGITGAAWNKWFKPNWMNDDASRRVWKGRHVGWDWSMTAVIAENKGLETLTPLLSRSNHIGRDGGVHCSAQFHDSTFSRLQVNKDRNISGYYIIGKEEPTSKQDIEYCQ